MRLEQLNGFFPLNKEKNIREIYIHLKPGLKPHKTVFLLFSYNPSLTL